MVIYGKFENFPNEKKIAKNAEFLSRTFFMSYVSIKQMLLLERYCFFWKFLSLIQLMISISVIPLPMFERFNFFNMKKYTRHINF